MEEQYYQLGSELLEYDVSSETWSLYNKGVTPPALTEQASAYDASTGTWYLFGGQSYYYVSDECYTRYNTGAETWSEWTGTTTPEPRKEEVLYLMISPKSFMSLVARAIMVCWMTFGRWMLQHLQVPMLYGKK